MPHSLRSKLSGLRYKGILEDKDYKRLCKALDNEKVFEQIRDEIERLHYHPKLDYIKNDEVVDMVLDIIDRKSQEEQKSGKWITTRTFMHDGEYYCDRCKCEAPNNEKWEYCPNCGARMESEE